MRLSGKVLRVSQSEVVVGIADAARLTMREIDGYAHQYPRRWLVFRPDRFEYDDVALLRRRVPKTHFVQMGLTVHASAIRVPDARPLPPHCTIRSPRSLAELRELTQRTTEEYFLKPWRTYLGSSLSHQFVSAFLDTLSINQSRIAVSDDLPIGMISVAKAEDCLEHSLDQVTWIWINQQLDAEIRSNTHYAFMHWLRERGSIRYQAGIHIYNERSLLFFMKMGFQPKCFHIIKKSAARWVHS